jgi:Zn-dependent protease with chaperone function
MDFFEAQDRAKRNTKKLVFYYVLAVMGIILSIYIVTLIFFNSQFSTEGSVTSFWYPGWLLTVSVIVGFIIASGTLYRVSQLRKGGPAVAEMLGGRKINPSTTDTNEQRLMNVVEEMAIASGISVPDVYVLDKEKNINAFAAGFSPNDAAIGVTRGTLEQLTRDELQGVIAHEFSHIFNGDMRFNIRLIGVLNGILIIHILGMLITRSVAFSGAGRVSSNRNGKGGNGAIAIILFGISLIVIGYIGMLFGRMIQSAISRQREFLADAAAVQFTRNPDGLAGALNKIGLRSEGGEINDGHAMEMSHLFFASSFQSALNRLFATHPPLEDRIKAINPSLAGEKPRRKHVRNQNEKKSRRSSEIAGSGILADHEAITPEVILGAIGTIGVKQVKAASHIMSEIPDSIKKAAHEPLSAQALMFAVMFKSIGKKSDALPTWFYENIDKAVVKETTRLMEHMKKADRSWYIPLVEISMPSLKNMSEVQYRQFREGMTELARNTNSDHLFLFALDKMVSNHLDTFYSEKRKPKIRHHHLKTIGHELSVLLSALAYASGNDNDAKRAFKYGLKPIKTFIPDGVTLLPKSECGLAALDKAMNELSASANPVKKYIVSSVIHCITADKVVTLDEAELTRAITEMLGAPIPMGVIRQDT